MNDYLKNNLSFASIIIPCRNEEGFIGKCLDSILQQDYPKEKIEILVVDGRSEDKTKNIIKKYTKKYPFIKLLDNPKKITPCALNIGIKNAQGEIIFRMDAHADYERNYISKCVKYLNKYNADNVGGAMKTVPKENTVIARAITATLSHPFGAGNSYFRIGSTEPRWVDTVFGGCYKKKVFNKIGLFNENLVRNQDLEFNLRLKKAKGKILLVPDIVSYYYPKSNFKNFFIHNFEDGFWVTFPLKFKLMAFSWRHLMPLFFVLGLIGSGILGIFFSIFFWLFLAIFGLYLLFSFYFSVQIATKEKNIKLFFSMPIAFADRHFGYGLGSAWGLTKLLFTKAK